MAFLRRTRESFGLDIGSSAVKVVQIRNGNGHRLTALGMVPLDPDTISEGAIKQPAVIAAAIREAVMMAGVRSRDAVIGVSGRELIIKKVQIPEVPAKELHDAVQLEAEHHIPFAIDEVFLDFHVVGTRDGVLLPDGVFFASSKLPARSADACGNRPSAAVSCVSSSISTL